MKKRIFAMLLAFVMTAGCLPAFVPRAQAADPVSYVYYEFVHDAYGGSYERRSGSVTEYTVIDSMAHSWSGWMYAPPGKTVISGRVLMQNEDVHLILADGAELVLEDGLQCTAYFENSLTIYGQVLGTGKLTAIGTKGRDSEGYAGIGGEAGNEYLFLQDSGPITIHGGVIYAEGSAPTYDGFASTHGSCPGIGGGGGYGDGTVTIHGGYVTARSGNWYYTVSDIGGGAFSESRVTVTGGILDVYYIRDSTFTMTGGMLVNAVSGAPWGNPLSLSVLGTGAVELSLDGVPVPPQHLIPGKSVYPVAREILTVRVTEGTLAGLYLLTAGESLPDGQYSVTADFTPILAGAAGYSFAMPDELCAVYAVFADYVPDEKEKTELGLYPVEIAGTDAVDLADILPLNHTMDPVIPGDSGVLLNASSVPETLTVGDIDYSFAGYLVPTPGETEMDEWTTSLVQSVTVPPEPQADTDAWYEWNTKYSDGIAVAYLRQEIEPLTGVLSPVIGAGDALNVAISVKPGMPLPDGDLVCIPISKEQPVKYLAGSLFGTPMKASSASTGKSGWVLEDGVWQYYVEGRLCKGFDAVDADSFILDVHTGDAQNSGWVPGDNGVYYYRHPGSEFLHWADMNMQLRNGYRYRFDIRAAADVTVVDSEDKPVETGGEVEVYVQLGSDWDTDAVNNTFLVHVDEETETLDAVGIKKDPQTGKWVAAMSLDNFSPFFVVTVTELPPAEDTSDMDNWILWLAMLYSRKYDVNAAATEGGTVTPAGVTEVQYGKSVTYAITPDAGYVIADVLVDGVSVGAVSEYTFANVKNDHTLTAVFKLKKVFDDVPADADYYEAVMYLYEKGSMIGTGGATFDPDGTLTRGMLVTILWRLSGEPVVNYAMPFTDVPAEEWYTEAVRWAAGTKLVQGWEDEFRPDDAITLEELAAVLCRYAKAEGDAAKSTQYKHSDWAKDAVLWADGIGLLAGIPTDLTADATRAEAALMVWREVK